MLSCIYCCCCSGHGNFGSVLKGEYTKSNGEKIPVAVKKLKSEEMNNPKVECTIACTCTWGRGGREKGREGGGGDALDNNLAQVRHLDLDLFLHGGFNEFIVGSHFALKILFSFIQFSFLPKISMHG